MAIEDFRDETVKHHWLVSNPLMKLSYPEGDYSSALLRVMTANIICATPQYIFAYPGGDPNNEFDWENPSAAKHNTKNSSVGVQYCAVCWTGGIPKMPLVMLSTWLCVFLCVGHGLAGNDPKTI